jgi:uncharacterized protein (DUF1499 family)
MKYIAGLLFFAVILILGTLLKNDAPLLQEPGLVKRLAIYFTTHVAQTSDTHPFPELRTDVFAIDADNLYLAVLDALNDLKWDIVASDEAGHRVTVVVTTPILLFKDDMVINIRSLECMNGAVISALDVRSSSRIGKGDFGANAGHIQQLIEAVRVRMEKYKPDAPRASTRQDSLNC